ncbi:CPBP family intramembrane glutamic endopeptidase [Micrococcus luteus]|uniref:CPBP family intramembrane glutamic endopeptidase n=1 Tax=Micrococcus luteus TaxID=1270 RepID=UPI00367DF36C
MSTPPAPHFPAPSSFPVRPPAPPLDLPLIGHDYPALLRTPRARWWNPLASFGLVVAGLVGLLVLGGVLGALALIATSGSALLGAADPTDVTDLDLLSAPMVLLNNLLLAALIGVALLAVALGHPVAARFVHSVEGRVRWRWLARCVVVLTPLFLAYVLGTWALDGAPTAPRAQDSVWLLVMAFVLTPFQAAGEEYLFRGWLLLAIGSWFRRPMPAIVIAAGVSAVTFSLAHGSFDPWILLDLSVFAVAAVLLTWRTGGLEAAVALHVVNNVVVIAFGTLAGTVNESFVDVETTGSPLATLVSAAVIALSTALLLWHARRAGIARTVPVGAGAHP